MLSDGSIVTILAPQAALLRKEIAAAILGVKDICTRMAGELLVKRGYVLSEMQGRETEQKAGTMIPPKKGSFIFFVKTSHPGDPVNVSFGGFLSGYACFLDNGIRCHLNDRVLVRNFGQARFRPDDTIVRDDAA